MTSANLTGRKESTGEGREVGAISREIDTAEAGGNYAVI
jgi:hypothetical protein